MSTVRSPPLLPLAHLFTSLGSNRFTFYSTIVPSLLLYFLGSLSPAPFFFLPFLRLPPSHHLALSFPTLRSVLHAYHLLQCLNKLGHSFCPRSVFCLIVQQSHLMVARETWKKRTGCLKKPHKL